MKALIVDASKSTRNVYRLIFEKFHIMTEEAQDAETALQLIRHSHFDLLIFAYDLDDMDGLSFYRAIPATPAHQIKVSLLITSRTEPALLHQALADGVTGCFSKMELTAIEQFISHFASVASLKLQGHVLLVEDSASAVVVYGSLLKKMGLTYDSCTTAEAAIAKIQSKQQYDLIVTDFSLAGVADAFSVINAVRSQIGQAARTPVLVMSALDTPMRRAQLLLNGANEFFSKAGLPEEFMVRVSQLIHTYKMLQHVEMQYLDMYSQATHDELTQLGNRYQLELVKSQIEHAAKTATHDTFILLIDIDNFKQINDKYGHPVGDMVLREVSQRLKAFFSNCPHLFRVGGEEFLVVLENTTPDQAEMHANAFRQHLIDTPPITLPVTISAGLAALVENVNFMVAYQAADKALYLAKNAGRNQVHWYENRYSLTEFAS